MSEAKCGNRCAVEGAPDFAALNPGYACFTPMRVRPALWSLTAKPRSGSIIQELMPLLGIDLVGPLPGDLQNTLVFTAVIMTGAKDAAAAKA